MRSLTTRLTTSLTLTVLILGGLFMGGLHYSLRHLAIIFVSARLTHDLDNLLTGLQFEGDFRLTLDQSRLTRFFKQPYSGHYFVVRAGNQVIRSRSLWDATLALPPGTERERERAFFLTGPNQQQLLALERDIRRQGQTVSLLVTEDFNPIDDTLSRLQLRIGLVALLVLIGLLIAQYLIVRRGLQPLFKVRNDMLRLSAGKIRQINTPVPKEIQPLVVELNRLLDILARRVERSHHALGNLAHALKTPLAVLTHITDQISTNDAVEIRQQAGHIKSLIERELKRSRIAGAATPGQQVQLSIVVEELVDTLQKIYHDSDLRIDVDVMAELIFPGDRNDLMELLGNLLDNACQWANHRIVLRGINKDTTLIISIEDDGPGCPPERLIELTERGTRLDESGPGHGLGLSIVYEIVHQYGGDLSLGTSQALGGFKATVTLVNRVSQLNIE